MTNVPHTLLRFFDREDYARRFIGGEIRFGLLEYYQTVEGSRQDDMEGHASFEWNLASRGESYQNVHYSGSSLNPYFIFSASHPEADSRALAEKFGQFAVRINDPSALLERIKECWKGHGWALEGCAFIAPVEYNKGG